MKRVTFWSTAALAFTLGVAAVAFSAAVDTPRTLMSRTDYVAARRVVEGETRATLATCRGASGAQRDICRAQAHADDRVGKADLLARYHGTASAAENARLARVKATYEVARAQCDMRKGDARLECLRAARATLGEARLAAT